MPRLLHALFAPDARIVLAVHFDLSISEIAVSPVFAEARAQMEGAGRGRARVRISQREFVTYRGISLAYNNCLIGAARLLVAGVWFDCFRQLPGAAYPTARPALISAFFGGRAVRDARLSFREWKRAEKWARFARKRLRQMFVDSALASDRKGAYETADEDRSAGNEA